METPCENCGATPEEIYENKGCNCVDICVECEFDKETEDCTCYGLFAL
jgi:hypothetical protein